MPASAVSDDLNDEVSKVFEQRRESCADVLQDSFILDIDSIQAHGK